MDSAIEGAMAVRGIEVDRACLLDFQPPITPCISCFECWKFPGRGCILKDALGMKGNGDLYQRIKKANGIILADPVHMHGPSSGTHVFMERCYPFVPKDELNGVPFASISCASSGGWMHAATREICRWAFCLHFKYLGGLPVHAIYHEEALEEARFLGREVAKAALTDEKEGRKIMAYEETWLHYADKPWSMLEPCLHNLTRGTFRWEDSLIEYGLRHDKLKKKEAMALLEKARSKLIEAVNAYRLNDLMLATKRLAEANTLWSNASDKEFFEENIVPWKMPGDVTYLRLPKEIEKNRS